MKVQAYNIVWDTDGRKVKHLPDDVVMEMDDDADIHEETADALSDHYGFCVVSLQVERK